MSCVTYLPKGHTGILLLETVTHCVLVQQVSRHVFLRGGRVTGWPTTGHDEIISIAEFVQAAVLKRRETMVSKGTHKSLDCSLDKD